MGRTKTSMAELARRTGIGRTTLAYQVDHDALTVGNLLLIARALGTEPSALLAADGHTADPALCPVPAVPASAAGTGHGEPQ
jgi:hypothetical protein